MTLIINAANSQQLVLLSDRRLSRNGKLVDDESNKVSTFVCRDARLAVAFTGVARAGTFVTNRWLLEALVESAKPDYLMGPTITRFRERANRDINRIAENYDKTAVKNGQPKLDKRLSVVLAGYSYTEDPPRCYCFLVSNFEGFNDETPSLDVASDEFTIHWKRESRPSEVPPILVAFFGESKAMTSKHVDALQELLKENRPSHALVGKAVEILHEMADSPKSGNVIGKQCTSIVLPCDPTAQALAQYHSFKNAVRVYSPSHIEARGGEVGAFVIDSPFTEIHDSSGQPQILEVPKVGRNHPCPCGSGTKYKRCHGGPRAAAVSFGNSLPSA